MGGGTVPPSSRGGAGKPRELSITALFRPGKLWLASPLTVAASAFTGTITAYKPGMFSRERVTGEPALTRN